MRTPTSYGLIKRKTLILTLFIYSRCFIFYIVCIKKDYSRIRGYI